MFKRQSMGKSPANGKQQQQQQQQKSLQQSMPQTRPVSMIGGGGSGSGAFSLFRTKQFNLSKSTASLASTSSSVAGSAVGVEESGSARPRAYHQLSQQQSQHRSVENLTDKRIYLARDGQVENSAPASASSTLLRPSTQTNWQQQQLLRVQREAKSASLPPQSSRQQQQNHPEKLHNREASILSSGAGSRQARQAAASLRVQCAVADCSLRLAEERLILTWDVWPTGGDGEGLEAADADDGADDLTQLRRELKNIRLLVELLRARLLSKSADPTAEADAEAAECVQRLQATVINAAAAANSLASRPVIARWHCEHQQQQQQQLNLRLVRLYCDRIEAALVGLQVAVAVEIGSSFSFNTASGSAGVVDSGGACLVQQCEGLSRSLSDLAVACRPQALPTACQPADREALQLCLRSVTAGATLLLHAVRTAHNRPNDADCRGRIELAAAGLRPALRALLGAASESRFSGRPVSLTGSERAHRVRILCRLLPVMSAASRLLTCLAERPGPVSMAVSPSGAAEWLARASGCVEEVRRVCADCMSATESAFS